MPLPETNIAWPPAALTPMRPKWAEWSAWYGSDTDALHGVYAGTAQTRDGVLKAAGKALVRYFWGETQTDLTKKPARKLHVPVASDLCQASADLLFSEVPTVSLDTERPLTEDGKPAPVDPITQATADRLEDLTGPEFHATLVAGAEVAAALGGCYLRATWDTTVDTKPFLTVVDYDTAYPVFKWGRLQSVTFWRTLVDTGPLVLRHLETHEKDEDGVGVIYHGLYRGTRDSLGQVVPLTEHPETAGFADLVDAEGKISTLSEGLDVFHWPNATPHRRWRTDPLGRHLGRSDLDGIEGTLDALDEAYTSLMRDVRLGKAMLMVPRAMIEDHGPGRGGSFTQDEVYSPVNASPSSVADSGLAVEQVQFAIRIEEHERTIALLWNTIIRSAGYSAQTFGEAGDVSMTATEAKAKERRSALSQSRKGREVRPVIAQAVQKMLALDAVVLQTRGIDPTIPVRVDLGDGFADDPKALAETANLLAMAVAASIETRVRLVNPDKDPTWIEQEVERIKAENNLDLADPDTVGVDGFNLSTGFPAPQEVDPEEEVMTGGDPS